MTDDFKTKILNWLTGNYTTSTGSNVPQFNTTTANTNNLETQLNTLLPYGYFLGGTLQGFNINNQGLGYTILYGFYYYNQQATTLKGFILILDEDFDIVQLIKQYSSGTDFGKFEIMGVGDDGNFFAIENTGSTKRFVMMNNIIAKLPSEANYKVVLRRSYNLSGQSNDITTYTNLIKAPEQSKYIIVGTDNSEHAIATELTVNVGVANDWVDYKYTTNQMTIGDIWANWDTSGNLTFKLAGFKMTNYVNLTYGELTGNSNNPGSMSLTTYGSQMQNIEQYSIQKKNSTEAYFSIHQYTSGTTSNQYIYHLKNSTLTQIKSNQTYYDYYSEMKLFRIGEELFYIYNTSSGGSTWYTKIGKIIDNTTYEHTTYTGNVCPSISLFMVQKQFNLYNYFVQIEDEVYTTNQIYNSLGYNGQEYQDLNSMIPNNATLSSNGVVIFARNLYNRIINNNTTTSILNVPNNFLNGMTIDEENLYSETNGLLTEADDSITTNIYEELMINFANTILMTNENDPNNIIENLSGATRVNTSISSVKDYNNCKIGKYKINYIDGTNIINNITGQNISLLRGSVKYTIGVYNSSNKPIRNIELISNDENTTYQRINLTGLGLDEFYVINQEVGIR